MEEDVTELEQYGVDVESSLQGDEPFKGWSQFSYVLFFLRVCGIFATFVSVFTPFDKFMDFM